MIEIENYNNVYLSNSLHFNSLTLHFIDLPDIWSVDWRQFEISFFRLCNVLDDNDDSSLASLTFGKYIFLGM